MKDSFGGGIPLQLDLGVRLSPALFLGGYVQYASLEAKNGSGGSCSGLVNCDAEMWRYGLQGHYHFNPEARFDPWFDSIWL
jgi:hypothetical protein